jgi:hypothetical protein
MGIPPAGLLDIETSFSLIAEIPTPCGRNEGQ